MNTNATSQRNARSAGARRLVLTLALVAVAGGIGAITILGKGNAPAASTSVATAEPASGTAAVAQSAAGTAPAPASPAAPESATAPAPTATPPTATPAPATPAPATAPASQPTLTAAAPGSPSTSATAIGSLDPTAARMQLQLTPSGAGIDRVVFSDLWQNARQAAEARAGSAPAEGRYELTSPGTLQGFAVPLLAARAIEVDGQVVRVDGNVWKETAPGTFVTELSDSTGALQLRATRRWSIDAGSYEIRCEQRVENLSAAPHAVRWVQFGPPNLSRDTNDSVDSRRFQGGYLLAKERDPAQSTVIVHDATLDQSAVVKQVEAGSLELWPNERQRQEKYGLSWFGATNRYFALAVHAPYAPPQVPSKALAPAVAQVQAQVGAGTHNGAAEQVVFTTTLSDVVTVAPGAAAAFDVGVFAGPLERSILGGTQPFAALSMQGLILYLMSGCCSWCTFSWLADAMVWFLAFLHDHVVFDWGLAIIVLVIVVRGLLHPLTRRSQISMMRVSKQMGAIKPELDALQKRYKDDPKQLQQETIRLYRERGVNPLGCAGGMLPTFLQMPIWIALYAVLYFAFELRQQPAFFGVFQAMGGWGFLGDLSAQDGFIPLPFSINLYVLQLSSVNLVPLLMGLVFWVQQKYMAPPPTPNMTPEQQQQQVMMKWMMVILFPFMLYTAPSGLTLYIATSTLVGIYESKRVKREIEKMDFTRPQPAKAGWLQNAIGTAMKRAQEAQGKAQARANAPSRKFRDR
jgi:YidC/Oxa1 family membrane protein insertase